jgi:chemotaxis protein methyltransferase CheR
MEKSSFEPDYSNYKFESKIIDITDNEYNLLSTYVYNNIGINLSDQKRNLLTSRLQKILREYSYHSFQEYYETLISDKTGNKLSELANVISTNHTFFWRENDHFEFFRDKVLPQIKDKINKTGIKDIRIWSAGCSSGEEPYMLIILMMDFFGLEYLKFDAGVLATDISEKALDFAKIGIYTEERMKYLPENIRNKYFKKTLDNRWEVIDKVKKEVTYRRFNLMNKSFPFKKQFDVIFCRNVMIYFDDITRIELVEKFYNMTAPGGYLFIGHAETLSRMKDSKYSFVKPALYQKR